MAILNDVTGVLSVWEIAHRWYGEDPNQYQSDNVPLNVQDILRLMSKVLHRHEMRLCNERGVEQWNLSYMPDWHDFKIELVDLPDVVVFQGAEITCIPDAINVDDICDEECEVFTVDPTKIPSTNTQRCCCYTGYGEEIRENTYRDGEKYVNERSQFHIEKTKNLDKCFRDRIYDKELLDNIYIFEPAIARLCREKGYDLPEFWFGKPGEETYEFYAKTDTSLNTRPSIEFLSLDISEFITKPHTERLERFFHVAEMALERFWKLYDPEDRTTSPNKDDVIKYLEEECKITNLEARTLQALIRDPRTSSGGRKT